mgnify:CR=1 FL=1
MSKFSGYAGLLLKYHTEEAVSPARNHKLAKAVYEKRRSGSTFKSIADELGLTHQRVQQIYKSEERYKALTESGFGNLKPHIRRALLSAIGISADKPNVRPHQIAERLHEGDLKLLGQEVYRDTTAWLLAQGFSVRAGFYNYHDFDGIWEAVTTHWPDGRKAPWTNGRIYTAFALNPERVSLNWENEFLEIRLEDLKLGFSRVS